jgi:hypothetical protein
MPKPSKPTLVGALGPFSAVHVLRMLQSARATGCLALDRDGERVELYIDQGRSVFARSTGLTVRVGDILVQRGELVAEAIELALAIQADQPGQRIGQMLIESGVVGAEQVRDAVLAVQRHILCGVLLWREGTFRFVAGKRAEEEDIRIDLDVDRLIIGILERAADGPHEKSDQEAA